MASAPPRLTPFPGFTAFDMHTAVNLFVEDRDVHVPVLSITNFIITSVLGIRYLGLLKILWQFDRGIRNLLPFGTGWLKRDILNDKPEYNEPNSSKCRNDKGLGSNSSLFLSPLFFKQKR